eukprot:11500760-Alexandrium_andersonii.AAC.1
MAVNKDHYIELLDAYNTVIECPEFHNIISTDPMTVDAGNNMDFAGFIKCSLAPWNHSSFLGLG